MTTDEERCDRWLSLGTQLGHWANAEYRFIKRKIDSVKKRLYRRIRTMLNP